MHPVNRNFPNSVSWWDTPIHLPPDMEPLEVEEDEDEEEQAPAPPKRVPALRLVHGGLDAPQKPPLLSNLLDPGKLPKNAPGTVLGGLARVPPAPPNYSLTRQAGLRLWASEGVEKSKKPKQKPSKATPKKGRKKP